MALDLSSSGEPDVSSSNDPGNVNAPSTLKAWGRKVSIYYDDEDEEESESLDGELEEKEALHLQALQATLLSQTDFDIQFPGNRSPLENFSVCSVILYKYVFESSFLSCTSGGKRSCTYQSGRHESFRKTTGTCMIYLY